MRVHLPHIRLETTAEPGCGLRLRHENEARFRLPVLHLQYEYERGFHLPDLAHECGGGEHGFRFHLHKLLRLGNDDERGFPVLHLGNLDGVGDGGCFLHPLHLQHGNEGDLRFLPKKQGKLVCGLMLRLHHLHLHLHLQHERAGGGRGFLLYLQYE